MILLDVIHDMSMTWLNGKSVTPVNEGKFYLMSKI